ncbi:hypothetical protein C8F04DRAFT_1120737 [Mycena alexandri]|uniref:Uncharacterized protein n=1 Tax=Mycena alexandri TaxID=1745969 RepID=A0AAD6SHA5_9AGAR|nr:hypothetical protein C8F04DRAFT_1120737 [Mycena alexandri]
MTHELVLRESVEVVRRNVFYGLQMAGLVGAIILLLTAVIWHKIARRHASWLNFMITWIISCSSYLFLMREPLGRQPDHNLCLFQAALTYSVPSLTSGATIALVVHIYTTLSSLLTVPTNRPQTSWATAALVIGPYIPAWAMFAFALRLGLGEPSLVNRPDDGTYCTLNTNLPGRVSAVIVATIMILCLATELVIFWNLRRTWATLQKDSQSAVAIIIRVLAFTLVGMLSIILSLIFLAIPSDGGAFNIVIALVPVSSVLIFGTQKDIFAAWTSVFRSRDRAHGDDTFTRVESRQSVNRLVV